MMNNRGEQAGGIPPASIGDSSKPTLDVNASKDFIDTTQVLGDALKIPGVNIDTYVIGQDLYIAAPSVSDDLEHKVAQCLTFAYDATSPKFHNADVETWYENFFKAL
jgi:hypothetical protein